MRKLISCFLALLIFLQPMAAVKVRAAEDNTCGANLTWTLDESGTLTVSGTGAMTEFSYAANTPWYAERGSIKTVVIEDGVTSIGAYAFYECYNLTGITIPGSVTTIGDAAFYRCTALTAITIPEGVAKIGTTAFSGCSQLTEVILPEGLKSIEDSAFDCCYALKEIDIPDSVTNVGLGAFQDCRAMKSAVIPGSVGRIAHYAFYNCNSLQQVTIGEGVTSIDDNAFAFCNGLSQMVIPASVTGISSSVFSYCNDLQDIYFGGTQPRWNALTNRPDAVRTHYSCTDPEKHWTEINQDATCETAGSYRASCPCGFEVSEETEALGHNYVEGICTRCEKAEALASGTCGANLTWVLDTDGTLTISGTGAMVNYAYSRNPAPWYEYRVSIKTLIIEDGVTSIGKYAFYGCTELTDVTIGETVTDIGYAAFYGCSRLTGIAIPDSVTKIEFYVFYDCTGLTDITIPDSVTSLGNYVFTGCTSLTTVTVGSGVTAIGDSLFYNCSRLTEVNLPEGITKIGITAFYGCTSLTNIEIPEGVTVIDRGAFQNCTGLTELTLPDSVTEILGAAFDGCTGLTQVTLGDNLTSIGKRTFSGCYQLACIIIPGSVTEIGGEAFNNCLQLEEVYFGGTKQQWEALSNQPDGPWIHYSCTDPENHWTQSYVEATCEAAGRDVTSCPCGYEISDEKEALGHNYVDGICTRCRVIGGTCGDNLSWTLDSEGNLTVSGTGDMTNYEYNSFAPWYEYRESVKTVVIRDGATSIGDCAFWDCKNLTEILIPDSVTHIGKSAFALCSNLTNVTLGNGITVIDDQAFMDCSSMTNITIPDSVTRIGVYAFYNCSNLITVDGGNSITHIDDFAFMNCFGMTSISIPACVTTIDGYAFSCCDSLEDVYYGGTAQQWLALENRPEAERIHYGCTTKEGHWETKGTHLVCPCGYTVGEAMENPFSDVPTGAFYYDAVMWAVANGVTTGATETTFNPNGTCQRAHVVTFLYRAKGSPAPTSIRNPFRDVPAGAFFYNPVLWAVENNITTGVDAATFGSFDTCNRAAVVTFLWRAAGSPMPTSTENPFVDVSESAFYYNAVLWAVENNITNGVDETHFGPTQSCSRAQVVTFLYRAFH